MAGRALGVAAWPLLGALLGAGLLGGCAQGGGEAADAAPALASARADADAEAPEVFQVTEEGLWDGRPSLGGVWVAHPDAVDPERVIIRNEAAGTFVVGALFRRERAAPGPALQVSSDAAEALSMLAGAPQVLSVTALRRDAPEAEPAAEPPVEGLAEAQALAVDAVSTDALPSAEPAANPDADPDPDAVGRATAALVAASAEAPEPSDAAPASTLERPLVQIGIFSVQGNADDTAADLLAQDLPARVVGSTVQGQPFWRVLVGPAVTEAEQEDLLSRSVAAGFPDAYLVRS